MSIGELIGKILAFGISTAAFVVCGVLVLSGPHASADTFNLVTGFVLLGLGALTGGIGVVSILAMFYEARLRKQEIELHVTPRGGPPAPPPAWGMGDVGRPGVIEVGSSDVSKGGTRVMTVRTQNLDAPLLVGFLLVWTLVAVFLLAPK